MGPIHISLGDSRRPEVLTVCDGVRSFTLTQQGGSLSLSLEDLNLTYDGEAFATVKISWAPRTVPGGRNRGEGGMTSVLAAAAIAVTFSERGVRLAQKIGIWPTHSREETARKGCSWPNSFSPSWPRSARRARRCRAAARPPCGRRAAACSLAARVTQTPLSVFHS